jgi:hypothetical protein
MEEKLKILVLEDVPNDYKLEELELGRAGVSFTSKCVETRKDFVEALKDKPAFRIQKKVDIFPIVEKFWP